MDQLNLMFLFSFQVAANTEKEGIKKAKGTVKKCEEFATALDIRIRLDHVGAFDGIFPVKVVFNIYGEQQSVLVKVSALFAFAASLQLRFVQQETLPASKQEA